MLKTFLGLSASLMVVFYTGVFQPHAMRFILFLALGPTVIGAACLLFINHVPYLEKSELAVEEKYCSTGVDPTNVIMHNCQLWLSAWQSLLLPVQACRRYLVAWLRLKTVQLVFARIQQAMNSNFALL